eukprot:1596240-Pyramimonas_sp.AAC.1
MCIRDRANWQRDAGSQAHLQCCYARPWSARVKERHAQCKSGWGHESGGHHLGQTDREGQRE